MEGDNLSQKEERRGHKRKDAQKFMVTFDL